MQQNPRTIHGVPVRGLDVDPQTRCAHYDGPSDVIALRFACCDDWFPCFECHAAIADHPIRRWPVEARHRQAVLCGACGQRLTVNEYLACDSLCPACRTAFNPGCARHHHLYFEPTTR